MTRKHFKAIAAQLKQDRPNAVGVDSSPMVVNLWFAIEQWQKSVRGMADVCQRFNDRFDRRTFYDACGYDPDNN